MKQASVASMKGRNKGRLLQQLPRVGTETRRIYDLLYANKGTPVRVCFSNYKCKKAKEKSVWWATLESLRNFYGLDIIKTNRDEWCLIGEWFGKIYIDYVAEKVNK